MEGCLPSVPKCPMNFTLFVMGIVGGESIISLPVAASCIHQIV